MIRYVLKCDQDHEFESWFGSAAAYDSLKTAGQIACPFCGSAAVDKTIMAPAVRTEPAKPLTQPENQIEQALAALRREVEENSDYVGMGFAAEARAMHEGTAPERSIYGEAKFEDAKALIEEGIPVTPLPFAPRRKTN
jgi:hypothetical protein